MNYALTCCAVNNEKNIAQISSVRAIFSDMLKNANHITIKIINANK